MESLEINAMKRSLKPKFYRKENLKLTNYNSQHRKSPYRIQGFLKWKYIDTKKSQYFVFSLKNNNNLEAEQ